MKSILFLLAIFAGLFATTTKASDCLNYLNHFQGRCGSYVYDPITINFRDNQGVQQEVTSHRIYNAQGNIVKADLDFKVTCPGGCGSNTEQTINSLLWSFRETYLHSHFFVISYCDPHNEICCDDFHCTEIYSGPPPERAANTLQGDALKRPNRRPREEYIPIIDSGLNLYDRAVRESRNEAEFRREIMAEQQAPMKFIITINNSGGHQVCFLTGSTCQVLLGNISVTDDFASVSLEHNYGPALNNELDYWLRNWFIGRERPLRCTQNMKCDASGDKCTIALSCYAP